MFVHTSQNIRSHVDTQNAQASSEFETQMVFAIRVARPHLPHRARIKDVGVQFPNLLLLKAEGVWGGRVGDRIDGTHCERRKTSSMSSFVPSC